MLKVHYSECCLQFEPKSFRETLTEKNSSYRVTFVIPEWITRYPVLEETIKKKKGVVVSRTVSILELLIKKLADIVFTTKIRFKGFHLITDTPKELTPY